MEFLVNFLSYFLRRLRPIWWQVGLVATLYTLPGTFFSTWFEATYAFAQDYDPGENMSTFVVWLLKGSMDHYAVALLPFEIIFYSLGVALILTLMQRPWVPAGPEAPIAPKPPLGQELRAALHAWPRLLIARTFAYVAMTFLCLLFCMPGIWFVIFAAALEAITYREDLGLWSALKRSAELISGSYTVVFALIVVLFVLLFSVTIPFGLVYAGLHYFYPVLAEPEFWVVGALLNLPAMVIYGTSSVYIYCIYEYLLWRHRSLGEASMEDFVRESTMPPAPVPPIPPTPPLA